ncbi:hypothetical protein HRG_014831 [Hirsutella rhossiliensis]
MAFFNRFFVLALALLASGISADVGCLAGRFYISASGECCSTDYARAERDGQGQVLNVRCGYIPGTLGPDGKIPQHLDGVRICNGVYNGDKYNCPHGVHASQDSITRAKQVAGEGCCSLLKQTRDKSGVCRRNYVDFSDAEESRAFWEARDRDGCTREGERGACCPDPKHFRNANKECSEKTSRGQSLPEWQFRDVRRSDGCNN